MAKAEDFEYTCTLNEETLELAKTELKEDPDTRLLELKALRDRLRQYPGLKARLDPQFLLRFLRARKFNQEEAFELVLSYYRMKKEDPGIFDALKPSNLTLLYDSKLAYLHSCRDRMGRAVYILHPARCDTSRYPIADAIKADFLNLSKIMEDEENQVRGLTLLVDYSNFSIAHIPHLYPPEAVRRSAAIYSGKFPARIKCILLVHESQIVNMIIGLFRHLVKAKLLQRTHRIGTDWAKLHEYIDPACLPPCYGGTLQADTAAEDWVEVMMKSDKEMEEEGKFGFVDYTLKPEADRKQEDAFSNMAGTFKKLNL